MARYKVNKKTFVGQGANGHMAYPGDIVEIEDEVFEKPVPPEARPAKPNVERTDDAPAAAKGKKAKSDAQTMSEAINDGAGKASFSPLDADGDGKMGGSVDKYDQMKADEIRAELDTKNVVHTPDMKKAELIALARDANA